MGAVLIDGGCAGVVIPLGYGVGWFDRAPWQVPGGWFWSEWWLSLWLDTPGVFTAPALWWGIVGLLGHVMAMSTWRTTPGLWAMGLKVVDDQGELASRGRLACRGVCNLLHPMTLGLSHLWIVVSRWGRGGHDVLCGCWVVRV